MNDTTSRAEALFHELLMARNGVERLKMDCSMFEAAREMVIAGIHDQHGPLAGAELKIEILRRTYLSDLSEAQMNRPIKGLHSIGR